MDREERWFAFFFAVLALVLSYWHQRMPASDKDKKPEDKRSSSQPRSTDSTTDGPLGSMNGPKLASGEDHPDKLGS